SNSVGESNTIRNEPLFRYQIRTRGVRIQGREERAIRLRQIAQMTVSDLFGCLDPAWKVRYIMPIGDAELARQLDVPTNRVTEILNGRRAITGDTALRLAHFFGTTAEFWLNLQSLYELRIAQKKVGKTIDRLPTRKHVEEAHA